MDDYLVIYHKTSDARPISFVCAKPRCRFISREEAFGARKTLKRLGHSNLSVGIDRRMITKPPTTKGGKINHS